MVAGPAEGLGAGQSAEDLVPALGQTVRRSIGGRSGEVSATVSRAGALYRKCQRAGQLGIFPLFFKTQRALEAVLSFGWVGPTQRASNNRNLFVPVLSVCLCR